MLSKWSIVLLLSFGGVAMAATPPGFDKATCQPKFSQGGRPFPTIPKQFQAKFAWHNHNARKSYHVEEWYSEAQDLGTMFVTGMLAPGITSQYITIGKTDEYFTIWDVRAENEWNNCERKVLSKSEQFALPANKDKTGVDVIVSGRALFNLGGLAVGDTMFLGNDTVNEIDVDVWQTCLFVESAQLTVNVTYYFTSNDTGRQWKTPGGYVTPVRIHAHGSNGMEQTFEYVYFSNTFASDNPEVFEMVFETPVGAYCAGRTDTRGLPKVPEFFSFRMEVIDMIAHTIMFTDEAYDFQANYSRMDYKDAPTGTISTDATISPKTLINDFNEGVTYAFDKYTGECYVVPISGGEFDSEPLSNSSTTRMRNPKEFFNFDNLDKWPYQFMGQHHVRGVLCDSWISWRPFPDETSKINATWQWFFAENHTIFKVKEFAEQLEPMRAIVTVPGANIKVQYNFYRFCEEEPDPRYFDVGLCFQDKKSVSYEFQLQGDWNTQRIPDHLDTWEYFFRISVESFSGVRAMRIQNLEFEFFDDRIQCRFTINAGSPRKVIGDVNNPAYQVDMKTAINRMTKSFDENQFVVYYETDAKIPAIQFVPVPHTIRVIEASEHQGSYRKNQTLPDPKKVNGPGLTSGGAVGLAFGMIALGAVFGIIGVFVYLRRNATGVNYKKQKLTTEESGDQ